jgi:hypothetical protein
MSVEEGSQSRRFDTHRLKGLALKVLGVVAVMATVWVSVGLFMTEVVIRPSTPDKAPCHIAEPGKKPVPQSKAQCKRLLDETRSQRSE